MLLKIVLFVNWNQVWNKSFMIHTYDCISKKYFYRLFYLKCMLLQHFSYVWMNWYFVMDAIVFYFYFLWMDFGVDLWIVYIFVYGGHLTLLYNPANYVFLCFCESIFFIRTTLIFVWFYILYKIIILVWTIVELVCTDFDI